MNEPNLSLDSSLFRMTLCLLIADLLPIERDEMVSCMLSQDSMLSTVPIKMHKALAKRSLSNEIDCLPANSKRKREKCHAGEERKSKDAQHSKRPCMHNKAKKKQPRDQQ